MPDTTSNMVSAEFGRCNECVRIGKILGLNNLV